MWQTYATVITVLISLAWLVNRMIRALRRKIVAGCSGGSCSGCPSAATQKNVSDARGVVVELSLSAAPADNATSRKH